MFHKQFTSEFMVDCGNPNYFRDVPVTDSATITFTLDYPLNKPVTTTLTHEDGVGWTLRQVLVAVQTAYRKIYDETPENTWGHCIADLVVDDLTADGARVEVEIGS